MKRIVKGLIVAAALFGASLAGVESASALPVANPAIAADSAAAPIETVGWRCGPGWHVNPWGRCVPNGYYRPYGFYAPRPVYRPYYRPYARPYYRPYARPYYHPYRRYYY
jgi:hypothetical protein